MNQVFGSLWRFWFQPAPAGRLALLRVFIGGYALWYVYTRWNLLCDLAHKSSKLWEPVGIFRVLGRPMDPVAVDWMVATTLIAGILFVLGWSYRYSGPGFALLLYATLCYRNSWSMIFHMHNLLVLHVLILGFVRAADRCSLDAAIQRLRPLRLGRSGPALPRAAAWEYGWPIRLICTVTVVGYFLAGVAKVMSPAGWMWAAGESMRSQIAVDTIRKEVLEGGGMVAAYLLYHQVWLFTVLGIVTYIVEIGAPLFLLDRRAIRCWAIATLGMHWGIYFIMGIKFRYQLSAVMFLPFFPVEQLIFWWKAIWSRAVGTIGRRSPSTDDSANDSAASSQSAPTPIGPALDAQ